MSLYIRGFSLRGVAICNNCGREGEFMIDTNNNIYLDEINELIINELGNDEYDGYSVTWSIEDDCYTCCTCNVQEMRETEKNDKAEIHYDNKNRL